jgi:putative flippase GtrA
MLAVALAVRAGLHYLLGQLVATGIATLITYAVNRRWTFGSTSERA